MRKKLEITGLFVLVLLLSVSVGYGVFFGQSSKQGQWLIFGAVVLLGLMVIALCWDLYIRFNSQSSSSQPKERLDEYSTEHLKLRSKDDHPNNAALN